jgi:hypothetical protein
MPSSSPLQSPTLSSSPISTHDTSSPHHEKPSNQQHHHFSPTIPHLHLPHLPHISLGTHLTSLFALTSHQQCTCSPYRIPDYTKYIIVDDEFVLVEEGEGEDGGPLCREATIESEGWKTSRKGGDRVMLRERKRRLSVHCFGG